MKNAIDSPAEPCAIDFDGSSNAYLDGLAEVLVSCRQNWARLIIDYWPHRRHFQMRAKIRDMIQWSRGAQNSIDQITAELRRRLSR